MRLRTACFVAIVTTFVGTLALWPVLFGQGPAAAPSPTTDRTKDRPAADLSHMKPLDQQMYRSAQAGADWLFRANRPDGHFDHGYLPALRGTMEGDHYLRQAGAAFALARAARYFGDDRHIAVARQAVLALLLDTTTESIGDPKVNVRHTTPPSVLVNRLASAGLVVLAINELPSPADELLTQSEELCAYIRRHQQADGSLRLTDDATPGNASKEFTEGTNRYSGLALYGLMRSQQYRPAEWKTEILRKALAYYRPWWQKNKNMAFVPWQTAACAEAFLRTGEQPFADFVNEMSDWVLTLQYVQLDPRHPLWVGGFMDWDGKPVPAAPQIGSARYAEGLAEACRVARKAGDLGRYPRYRDGLVRCLQFLAPLQYTDANTQHFADWYRRRLLGGFYPSHQDGNLRIDYTQHAVCALVQYLQYVSGE